MVSSKVRSAQGQISRINLINLIFQGNLPEWFKIISRIGLFWPDWMTSTLSLLVRPRSVGILWSLSSRSLILSQLLQVFRSSRSSFSVLSLWNGLNKSEVRHP